MRNGGRNGGKNGGSRPVPDPTVLTTQQLNSAIDALGELMDAQHHAIEQRMTGMEQVRDEKFRSVDLQFKLAEQQRLEQKEDTKAAVDAALTAQKEAVREQTLASEKAIDKSESGTTRQLEQLRDNFSTAQAGLTAVVTDLKERVGKMESIKIGGQEVQQRSGAVFGIAAAVIGVLLTIVAIVVTVVVATSR